MKGRQCGSDAVALWQKKGIGKLEVAEVKKLVDKWQIVMYNEQVCKKELPC